MLQWILLVILKNNSWFFAFPFYPFNQNLSVPPRRDGKEMFFFLTFNLVIFFNLFCEEKFNNAKILITSKDVGVETGIERGRRRDETKAFYCVLNHKMRFSSSIKSKSSRKNNILLATSFEILMNTSFVFEDTLSVYIGTPLQALSPIQILTLLSLFRSQLHWQSHQTIS